MSDSRPRSWRAASCAALAATAAMIGLPGPGAALGAEREVDPAAADRATEYWTPARMRAAQPPPPPGEVAGLAARTPDDAVASATVDRDEISDPAAEPFRSHGKVFFTIVGGSAPGDYVCSGTAIDSPNESTVWSAGHCIYDTEGGGFASNWIFVPAYKNGTAPFGEWPAEQLAVTSQWKNDGSLHYDLGAAAVATNGAGESLNDVVGGRGIAFSQDRSQTYEAFGYPAQQPPLEFNGRREFRCTSPLVGTDSPPGEGPRTSYIACDMTAGSSGGGWVVGDAVFSVVSYSYCTAVFCDDNLYGPYQDDVAQSLYTSVAGEVSFCNGLEVTIEGTSGDDELVGTSGPDVFSAGAGADEVIGKGDDDTICAGKGRDLVKGKNGNDTIKAGNGKDTVKGQDGADELRGGDGKDQLQGGQGPDDLRGGNGTDTCKGGKGRDSASSCEKKSGIP